jgi:hypothetical protein
MKIYGLDSRTITSQQSRPAIKASMDFQDLLRAQLEKVASPTPVEATQEAGQIGSTPAGVRVEGLTLTEASLNTLEAFSAALANPAIKGEELQPFIGNLQEETAALLTVRNQLHDQDPLATLLDRVAALAYLETAKYQRGDYAA